MAQPSSTHRESRVDRDRDREDRHRDRDRERERERERERRSSRSHHHHRTISSTTLLLVLSLVLAVLAVMLSLPSSGLPPIGNATDPNEPQKPGVWGILTPKRSQELVRREGEVARREADVARREAELLAGAPGGVLNTPPPPPPPVACPICPTLPPVPVMPFEPVQTVIKEVVKETTEALTPPGWYAEGQMRFQDILDRELKIADREREISRREETVNRREHDAARREAWIMEQLIALGNDEPAVVEEEVYYDSPRKPVGRAPKDLPPPLIYTETAIATEYKTVTKTEHHTRTQPTTKYMPQPAKTKLAAFPTPEPMTVSYSTGIPKTTAISFVTEEVIEEPEPLEEIIEEEIEEVIQPARTVRSRSPPPRPPSRWLGGW